MKASMSNMILASTCVILQWCYFGASIPAIHEYTLVEEEDLHNIGKHLPVQNLDSFPQLNKSGSFAGSFFIIHKDHCNVWHKPLDPTDPTTIDHLQSYLERTAEEQKKSEPFFTYTPDDLYTNLAGVDSVKLMNNMLQSDKENWPEHIQNIFKADPTDRIKNFWAFIAIMSEFMSTPVLQKTFFEIGKEEERLLQRGNLIDYDIHKLIPVVLDIYATEIKEHVKLLETGDKPRKVIDIFTRDEQTKVGEHGIQLEKQWAPTEEVELYRNWASNMMLYLEVEGSVKGILETQALQVRLVKKIRLNSLGIIPYEISQCLEPLLSTRVQDLTDELLDSIKLLDEKSWLQFWSCQVRYDVGIRDRWCDKPDEDTRKSILFWVKYMPFYLQMKASEDTWDWYYLMEEIIVKDIKGDHALESVMNQFLTNPPPLNTQDNLIVKFLEFVVEMTQSQSLRKIAKGGLEIMSISPTPWFVRAYKDYGAEL
ncbi:uncharacterized protein MELLADRAFT_94056 [Melampsora larici-populina 98AG31]|uniref:Secreted protein n=1 Tax=Melampsora larici-populina (strain 98AG31 / pathotype 3-4-7) TaxID=747676 RepID=F4S691_MELLP|nr:uncharacterized protein MELLADRAFT_94056 [Melampsora larici-populina 98AG31]EGF99773.1 hypothetical protein MELLADRAFT_94056 [Melampsora larici-populina 98AG31]